MGTTSRRKSRPSAILSSPSCTRVPEVCQEVCQAVCPTWEELTHLQPAQEELDLPSRRSTKPSSWSPSLLASLNSRATKKLETIKFFTFSNATRGIFRH